MVMSALVVTGCTTGTTTQPENGTIRGLLLQMPAGIILPGTLPHPMAGTVVMTFTDMGVVMHVTVTVGSNGRFSRAVAAGRYKLVPGPKNGCASRPVTAKVMTGKVVTVKVRCGSTI